MQQEVVLAMLATEPSHGDEPSARRRQALGSLREALNPGQRLCQPDPAREGGPGDLRAGGGPGGLAGPQGVRADPGRPATRRRVARRGELAQTRPGRVPSQAGRGGGGRAGRPAQHRGHAAPRAAAPAARRPARCACRARELGRGAVVGGHRAAAAGGPALAGGVRTELDRPKEQIMRHTTDTSVRESGEASVLRARGLRKHYGHGQGLVRAVDGVDVDVAPGETVAVMGPSGCGKSTLLHLLGGLDRPSGGEVWLAGRRIDQIGEKALARMRRSAVGFVFQAFHLMDELTARENIELSALMAGRSPRAARRRAADLLERVGLADRAGFLPSALSGGQRQRVAIARALSNEPLVLLADEPTGSLDSAATLDVLRLFERLHDAGQTLVVVTHDERIAATADRLISMRDGAFVDETRLTGGTTGQLGALAGLEGGV